MKKIIFSNEKIFFCTFSFAQIASICSYKTKNHWFLPDLEKTSLVSCSSLCTISRPWIWARKAFGVKLCAVFQPIKSLFCIKERKLWKAFILWSNGPEKNEETDKPLGSYLLGHTERRVCSIVVVKKKCMLHWSLIWEIFSGWQMRLQLNLWGLFCFNRRTFVKMVI